MESMIRNSWDLVRYAVSVVSQDVADLGWDPGICIFNPPSPGDFDRQQHLGTSYTKPMVLNLGSMSESPGGFLKVPLVRPYPKPTCHKAWGGTRHTESQPGLRVTALKP